MCGEDKMKHKQRKVIKTELYGWPGAMKKAGDFNGNLKRKVF